MAIKDVTAAPVFAALQTIKIAKSLTSQLLLKNSIAMMLAVQH